MEYKVTRQLFRNKYQYKIVLVSSGAQCFRSGDLDAIYEQLTKLIPLVGSDQIEQRSHYWAITKIKSKEELDHCFKLHKQLSKMSDFEIRIESPWITVYSNNKADIDNLKKIDVTKVKYISEPAKNSVLEQGVVIMTSDDYDYKVTMGKTTKEYLAFVEWAETNKKLKLTKSCIRDLSKNMSWGGTHFYVAGEKNLLLAKMHLGGSINKIERVVKSDQ